MFHFVLPVLFFCFFFSSTAKLSQLCQSFTVRIQKNLWLLPTVQRSTSSVLCVYWSKQNESQDGRVEVSCDQLRWYLSTESVQHENIFLFFFFLSLNMKHCSFTVSPSHPTCSCPDAVLYPRRWGVRDVRESRVEWRTCSGLHDEKESTRQREKKRKTPSIRVLSSTLPHRHTDGCCTADRWARGERRGGFNWSGISGNQSVFWSVIRSSEWVQPPLSPMPTPVPPPHTPHPTSAPFS